MCCLQAFGLWFSQESEAVGDLQLHRVPHGQGEKIHCISPFYDLTIASVRLQTALFVRECEKLRWEAAAQAKLGKSDFSPQTPAQFVAFLNLGQEGFVGLPNWEPIKHSLA